MRDGDLTTRRLAELGGSTGLMRRQWPPCRYHCPVHADVRGYLELIARGRHREAIDLIRESLPMAAVCGRICHHPCEANCRRNDVDQPLAIREVKRFVAELQGAAGSTVLRADVQDKARVAIVGGGPAGLSAALDLARLGYRPTIFEKFQVAGGIPATAVPRYRLPRDVIAEDVRWVLAHGVDLQTGAQIGADRSIAQLQAEGFEAVLVAVGLAASRRLPLSGMDHPRAHLAMPFLTELALERAVDVGQDVLVIGGGNVAIDAARSAVRLGPARVRMVCLEDADEMPAWDWEKQGAAEEGVGFVHRRGPVEIVTRDGEIVALRARKVTRVFDEAGRFDPTYDEADVIDLECDTVILAIGQAAEVSFAAGSGLAIDPSGRLDYNAASHETNVPGVFACGEIVTGAGSVVEACAHGRRAARAIDLYLTGRPIAIDDDLPPEIGPIDAATAERVTRAARAEVFEPSGEQRAGGFAEIDRTLDESAALAEARRCMSCGAGAEVIVDKCAACLTCLRVCPFDIPVVTDVARIDSALCQACGMCIADCPANAIVSRGWEAGELAGRTARALAAAGSNGRARVVAYVCGHHAPANAWAGSLPDAVAGVAEVYLPSMSRLSSMDVLAALERGADGVIVVACRLGADRYPGATQRIRKRVSAARQMLRDIGMDERLVQLCELAAEGRAAMREAMGQAADLINEIQKGTSR